jgi:hypothetical protein
MEWLNTLYILVIGLALRFIVPALVTLVIILWLRSLDNRWQKEAEVMAAETEPASFWAGRTPCWDVRHCTTEMQAKCPVFQDGKSPCWQLLRNAQGELKEECLDCNVFLDTALPQPL